MRNTNRTIAGMDAVQLAQLIDHTRLGPDTTARDIDVLCQEAVTYGFASVCVPPCYVKQAKLMLMNASPVVCTVCGFPHGNNASDTKAKEASIALEQGAVEIDMVMAIGQMKSGFYEVVQNDIMSVVRVCKGSALLKVILECALLTDEEKRTACKLARDAGADYVKTSTGYAHQGATLDDISLMKDTVGDDLGIKASGGIRTGVDALAMVNAGATRLGASASVAIIESVK